MRVFITSQGDARRTRVFLENCASTSDLINKICKQLRANKNQVIIKLKYEPYNLIIIGDWPLTYYPIRNGSTFIVEFNSKQSSQQSLPSTKQFNQPEQDLYQSFYEIPNKLSFISGSEQIDDGRYLEESLMNMLQAVRNNNLEAVAQIINEQPKLEDKNLMERQIQRKYEYLLNELGQYGRNALHEAIQIKNIDIVSYLIIKGSDPTILTVDQFSPIQLAVIYQAPQILDLLLQQKKVNINQVTAHGTALHLAVSSQEIKPIQILFQNDVDVQTKDLDGRKATDMTNNQKLKKILQSKSDIRRVNIPHITKGNVINVSSSKFYLLNSRLIVNPFKNQALILKSNNQNQAKFHLTSIKEVKIVTDKKQIINKSHYYFKIHLKVTELKQILVEVKQQIIRQKWIQSIKAALFYREVYEYVKPVVSKERLIQILDDETGEISLYRRKSQFFRQSKRPSCTQSIRDDYQLQSYEKIIDKVALAQSGRQHDDFLRQAIQEKNMIKRQMQQKSSIRKNILILHSQDTVKTLQSLSQKSSSYNSNKKIETCPISEAKLNIESQNRLVSFRDFKIIKLVGNGSFAQVYSAINKNNGRIYALKVLNKKKLMNKKQLKYAVGEVSILKKVNFPFIINLSFAFQTPLNIYIALDVCTFGDLSELIVIREKLKEDTYRFVIAQIILAIEYLHNKNVLYRDLKPQNILIASDGYIRLTDFGLSKQDSFSMSFCGSPAYLSPEMLQKNGVGFSSDIYGIGCVLYQMIVGQPAFFDQKLDKLFENIKYARLTFPQDISVEAKSLVKGLMERDMNTRLGVKDFSQIKSHQFFKNFNWSGLIAKQIVPPLQIFTNDQGMKFQPSFQVQDLDQIKINDIDYDQIPEKMTKIKKITFIKSGELSSKNQ